MTRAVHALALVSLTFAVALSLYSLSTFMTYVGVFAVFPQVLRTTGMALGLATAVVAVVASAQERRWRRFGLLLFLAILTPYSPYLVNPAVSLIPALSTAGELVWLRLFLLSYAVPAVTTALVILAGEGLSRIARPHLGSSGDETDGLEFTPLDA